MVDGDIILKIDNVELRRIEDLVAQVRKRKVGEKVKIFALHDVGKTSKSLNLRKHHKIFWR
jgi:S1-C subfamily serine protease